MVLSNYIKCQQEIQRYRNLMKKLPGWVKLFFVNATCTFVVRGVDQPLNEKLTLDIKNCLINKNM